MSYWTYDKPTEPGFWWYDPEDGSEFNPPNIRHVYQLAFGDDRRLWLQGEPLENFTPRGRWSSEKVAMPHEPLPPPCPGCGRHKPRCDCPPGMYT